MILIFFPRATHLDASTPIWNSTAITDKSFAMAITILPPVVEDARPYEVDSDDDMSMDSEEDVEMTGISRPHKRPRLQGNSNIGAGIVTPGEVVTDDPQWMRLVQP